MRAMVTMGHGDIDQIVLHETWKRPDPAPGEVLVQVGACGLNNTDVNTRSGWYSKTVTEATTGGAYQEVGEEDPSWGGAPIVFPRIQGADVAGKIVAVGEGVDPGRIGERIIVDCWLRDPADPMDKNKTGYFGSERDGGFAEYATMPARNALAVNCSLSDAELATFSCSYSTGEGMLTRANVTAADTVLVPGASGGVGGAVVQLAKRRGARVIAMASEAKHDAVAALGPDVILPRAPENLRAALGDEKITVVADVVGGPYWPKLIDILERGGRYTCSGAIAGPMVEFDLRTFYLRDLTFTGSTVIDPEVMPNLVRYIEAGEIKPALAATYPLEQLREAQTAFIAKNHTGNIVVTP
ncbi:alcohol dehydrogenase family protein [Mameliella alba]|nr:alcohol dehydrogenase family protein [Mameliella sediminis]MBY6116635.1 alcohol dehydrogenase family protein [Antarctobacter heliothermus]MBY6146388.1 alcohol dehydrogenase family protein [Mameliella alba]MBY6163018.1 alcohol dehydrogenase family protein [Mameliella alba]MBY6171282.1 alcohol dehydrogenase family protein [Mameliella alba]